MLDPVSLATIFTSLIPTASYAVKRIVDHNTGGPNPTNAGEAVELRKADVEVLRVTNTVPANISRWVANIIALQRPIVVYTVLLNWSIMTIAGLMGAQVDLQIYVIMANMASAVFFYLFGDRTLMYSLQTLNTKLTGSK